MTEQKEKMVMRINFGMAELAVALLTITLSAGGSWVMMKEEMAKFKEVATDNKEDIEVIGRRSRDNERDILLLTEKNHQLVRSTESYSQSLDGLREVLSELNTTLGRMDERMQNVEKGIQDLRN